MWSKLVDDKIDPNALGRSGHSTTTVGKKLLVFGGTANNIIYFNDVLFFDTENSRWHTPQTSGTIPTGRTKHTATLIGSKLYVFGGGDSGSLNNELYCLDLGMF